MKRILVAASVAAGLLLAACGGTSSATTTPATGGATAPPPPAAALTGAGSTFVYPYFSAAFYAYHLKYSQATVNYQSIGSGAGIQQFVKKTVDFGASDVPAKDSELQPAGGSAATVQFPVTLGTEGLAYNLSGVSNGQLKLTPSTIAGIYLGNIKNWNDPALAAENSGVSLPSQPIKVIHRSDGSGTTYIFTDYLSNVSADWKAKVGTGKSVNWPVGLGAKGNEAVATTIQQTPGAIGYVELAYILQTNMTQAKLQNHDGNFVLPSPEGATAAASQFAAISPTQFSIVNAPGKNSAPISGYVWVMLSKDQTDKTKGTALVDLFDWAINEGQQYAVNVHYAKLPTNIVRFDVDALKSVTSGGSVLLAVSS